MIKIAISKFVYWAPLVALVSAVFAFAALAYAYNANATSTREQKLRTTAIEQQSLQTRLAFCGLVEGYAYGSGPATTQRGIDLQQQFINAAHSLGCTPDPKDGK